MAYSSQVWRSERKGRRTTPLANALTAAARPPLLADYTNGVRRVSPLGTLSAAAPASLAGGWGGLASDLMGGFFASVGSCVQHALRNASSAVVVAGVCGASSSSGGAGPATAVLLGAPRGLALTGTGGLLIADQGAHCVRVLSATGQLGVVAGTCGTSGATADGGPATVAQLGQPFGVATDARGGFVFTVRRAFLSTPLPPPPPYPATSTTHPFAGGREPRPTPRIGYRQRRHPLDARRHSGRGWLVRRRECRNCSTAFRPTGCVPRRRRRFLRS